MIRRRPVLEVWRWPQVALAFAFACASAPAPSAPAPSAPVPKPQRTPLPDGLAVTVRVDVETLGNELGNDLARDVLLRALAHEESTSMVELLELSLARARVLWYGLPSLETAVAPDPVLILRGHFASLDTSQESGWTHDASGLARLVVRDAPVAGGGYSRVYRPAGDEVLVWTAERAAAAIERALRRGPDGAVLRPPERGAVSVAANPEPLLALYAPRYPELARRFEGVQGIEAFAEPGAGVWRAELTLDFDTPEHAGQASLVLEQLKAALAQRTCAVGAVARALDVTTFENDVRVRAALLGPELDALRACVLGGGCCA